jgi:hypothetical protein
MRVVDTLILDAKRRVVCLSHNGDHYLILLGQNNDIVLKSPAMPSVSTHTPMDIHFTEGTS